MVTPSPRRGSGFTLIEMMITLVIAAILLVMAAPSFRDFILNQRAKQAAGDLFASLLFARSEAIKRGTPVDLAPVSGSWSSGWTVSSGTTELRRQPALKDMAATGPDGAISFGGSGRLTAAAEVQFDFTITDNPNVTKRCIVVDPSGRPATFVDYNHDGNCFNG